jgi:hypothetical protein
MTSFNKAILFSVLSLFAHNIFAAGLNGDYEAKNSTLHIEAADNSKLTFNMTTANADCTGEIPTASATLSGNSATFNGENACVLRIDFNNEQATVHEENCTFYHGMRCAFDGVYAKKAELPKDVTALLSRKEMCEHWRGEEPSSPERAKEINTALSGLHCKQLAADSKKLQQKYSKNSNISKALSQ